MTPGGSAGVIARTIAMAMLGVAALSPAVAARWKPAAAAGVSINGVWRSRGYGRILVMRGATRALYHVAGRFCYRDPSGGGAGEEDRLVSIIDRNRIVFAAAPDQTHYAFDRIAALPPGCTVRRRWTTRTLGELVAVTFANLYPGFGRRGRTLARLSAALRSADARSPDPAFYRQVTDALGTLDDAHVGLDATIDGVDHAFESGEAATIRAARADPALGTDPADWERQWLAAYRKGIVGLLEGGGHHVANRRILWGRIGGVGYLNIVTMGAFAKDAPPDDTVALDAALDEAIAAFRGSPGVIVDVTGNRGGYDAVALRIAGRFADRRRPAFAKRAVGARGGWQRFDVVPSARPRYLGKVALLTSDITMSAGETFVLAMRALPQVVQAGARTRGALSDQLDKPLPNGWVLTLPAEDYRDAAGRSQEGIGIAPARPLPPFVPDHRSMIEAAVRLLSAP